MSGRGWRALAFVGLAVLAVVAVGVAHLGGWPAGAGAAPRPTSKPAAPWRLVLASFGDVDRGAVVMAGSTQSDSDTFVTFDGGRTWQARHVGPSATTFLDRSHAFAVRSTPSPRLWATGDGGRTWVSRATPVHASGLAYLLNRSVGGPAFLNPEEGWWLSAPPTTALAPVMLWRTSDGGRTWSAIAALPLPDSWRLADAAFLDRSTAAVAASADRGTRPAVLTTSDGGRTWTPGSLPDVPVAGGDAGLPNTGAAQLLVEHGRLILSVDLLTMRGDEFVHLTSVSQDGGRTWAPWAAEPASPAQSFASPIVDDAGRLLVVDDRTLWISSDDGRTWQRRPLHLPAADHGVAVVLARGDSLVLATVDQPPNGVGLPHWRLLHSDDGGDSWPAVRLPGRPG